MRISNFSQPPVIRHLHDLRVALQGEALTVCGPEAPAVHRAIVDAFARRGLRAWSTGDAVRALDAEQTLALERLELQLDEARRTSAEAAA